jgi:hypothetical protein
MKMPALFDLNGWVAVVTGGNGGIGGGIGFPSLALKVDVTNRVALIW